MLLHVVDASAEDMLGHEKTVLELLKELKMDRIPMLTVYNKRDLITGSFLPDLFPSVLISARNDDDLDLVALLGELLVEVEDARDAE